MKKNKKIIFSKNGPYLVSGNIKLKKAIIQTDKQGNSVAWEESEKYFQKETYALCRCGNSKNKPFCSGECKKTKFNGRETANQEKYIKKSQKIIGEELDLLDENSLCAGLRFCHDREDNIWDLAKNHKKSAKKKKMIKMACNCSSGRLTVRDKQTGELIEPKEDQEICLVEDKAKKSTGPIWVKGGIAIESDDGRKYEKRNRATLRRCGKSKNKPFCDASHLVK